ncbi:MarR family winged helix-turn-helix transcriptional regulator [Prauserella cavernicola]|uniref:MarR family transcriptional regulator n=1 Tax=Prauserella cavernicola TaxID=2800127 RepID=A0A934V5I1_9PSEU|nr:MarR family transcriptional regulator [Prauserella cavernicola]MBK1784633.1 MarR family transcriptional regulator [Prauserella cavernicola]
MISGVAELAHELRPLLFRLYYLVRRQTPQLTLTLTQGSVLAELVQGGPRRMSALAELEGVRLPSMTDVVARLERDGLVSRAPDPADRRAVLVTVTAEGTRFHDELIVAREEFLRERLAAMTQGDRSAIDAALPALRRLLEPSTPREEVVADER